MAEINYTKLRYIKSKDKDLLIAAVERLPFKIEIKALEFVESWYCWFTLSDLNEFKSLDLDMVA